jgi:hypothetical protein
VGILNGVHLKVLSRSKPRFVLVLHWSTRVKPELDYIQYVSYKENRTIQKTKRIMLCFDDGNEVNP